MDRTLDTRAFLTVKLLHFYPNLDSSNKPPDPGATSQGPAGGAYGLVCLLVATYIPPFPLRVLKEEPCADVRRPLHWAARRSRSLGPRPGGVANPPNGESRGTFTRTH